MLKTLEGAGAARLARRRCCRSTAAASSRPDALREAITDDTALVSVMHANNEIGTHAADRRAGRDRQGARRAGAHRRGADGRQDRRSTSQALGVDLLSISAHKFYGPKGIGALWLRKGVRLLPFVTGGRQERNRRAGTENVPAIVGLGAAAELAPRKMARGESRASRALRDRLEAGHPGGRAAARNATARPTPRVPNTTNISFERIESESLLIGLDLEGIAVSSGSACSSGTLEPSHVLKAMGLPHARTLSSIRFSLGAGNTEADIDRVIACCRRWSRNSKPVAWRPVR